MARVKAILKRPLRCYRAGTCESDLRIYGRPGTAMLQVRRHRLSGFVSRSVRPPLTEWEGPHAFRRKLKEQAGFGSLLQTGDRVTMRETYRKKRTESRVWQMVGGRPWI